jgi:hypothetical protein
MRASGQSLKTGDPFNLSNPGGAQTTDDGTHMVFHANCDKGRCMYETTSDFEGKRDGSLKFDMPVSVRSCISASVSVSNFALSCFTHLASRAA